MLSYGLTFGIWPLSNPLGQFMVKQGDIHKTVHLHSELKTNYVFGAIRVAEVGTLSAKTKMPSILLLNAYLLVCNKKHCFIPFNQNHLYMGMHGF